MDTEQPESDDQYEGYPAWMCIFYLWLPATWLVMLIAWLLGYDVGSLFRRHP